MTIEVPALQQSVTGSTTYATLAGHAAVHPHVAQVAGMLAIAPLPWLGSDTEIPI